uniref:Uncharacterized protein n=1 Tax=Cacopsylla melanoneura TaxID=428564 RepID=A0A8D8SFP1_9HEMI
MVRVHCRRKLKPLSIFLYLSVFVSSNVSSGSSTSSVPLFTTLLISRLLSMLCSVVTKRMTKPSSSGMTRRSRLLTNASTPCPTPPSSPTRFRTPSWPCLWMPPILPLGVLYSNEPHRTIFSFTPILNIVFSLFSKCPTGKS